MPPREFVYHEVTEFQSLFCGSGWLCNGFVHHLGKLISVFSPLLINVCDMHIQNVPPPWARGRYLEGVATLGGDLSTLTWVVKNTRAVVTLKRGCYWSYLTPRTWHTLQFSCLVIRGAPCELRVPASPKAPQYCESKPQLQATQPTTKSPSHEKAETFFIFAHASCWTSLQSLTNMGEEVTEQKKINGMAWQDLPWGLKTKGGFTGDLSN